MPASETMASRTARLASRRWLRWRSRGRTECGRPLVAADAGRSTGAADPPSSGTSERIRVGSVGHRWKSRAIGHLGSQPAASRSPDRPGPTGRARVRSTRKTSGLLDGSFERGAPQRGADGATADRRAHDLQHFLDRVGIAVRSGGAWRRKWPCSRFTGGFSAIHSGHTSSAPRVRAHAATAGPGPSIVPGRPARGPGAGDNDGRLGYRGNPTGSLAPWTSPTPSRPSPFGPRSAPG